LRYAEEATAVLREEMSQEGGGRIPGIVLGTVTNNKDPEKLGRIKVMLPWHKDGQETDWAWIVTLMAGKKKGTCFLPDQGDQVAVAFDHGDIDYPYILGCVWDSDNKPPVSNEDGKNNVKMIASRCGHKIIFDDDSEQKKEKLEIHSHGGHRIIMDDSSGNERIEIQDKSGNSLIMDLSKKEISITSKSKITLKNEMNCSITMDSDKIAVSSSGELSISSNSKISFKAPSIDLDASGMANIKASGPLKIQGAIVNIN
jgi:uncharacterized protein involved in type VI secretion and phage assembly